MNKIRTRIAPSPTGAPHIGTAYMALFNLAFARRHGGAMILRIEDTDRRRSTAAFEAEIMDALRWLGIGWDEGPDSGGPFGPYRQSERTALYREHLERLWRAGHAYPCFCSAERLASLRAEQAASRAGFQGYDRACAAIAGADARRRISAGESHVFRMRVPEEGDCLFNDGLRGEIAIPWSGIDDQVLLKSDGYPTYHLANVVDDHCMAITHVIRGEEWISSTPKHILLYRMFEWEPPVFAHLPLLRNPDRSKLSKRKNPTGILYYRAAGFLPETLLNFLGLISYGFPDGREEFDLADFCADFELERVSLGGPVFDIRKLREFNARRLRRLPVPELLERLRAWRLNDAVWERILTMARPRLNQLSDAVPMAAFLFDDRLAGGAEALLRQAGGDGATAVERLRIAQWEIEAAPEWNADAARALFERMAAAGNTALKKLMPLFFVCFCGAPVSLPIFESLELLGRDLCLRRVQYALEDLDGAGHAMGGKALKALRKRYERQYAGDSGATGE